MECFTVHINEIEGRLDSLYYLHDVFLLLKRSPYMIKTIGEVTTYLKTGFAAGASQQEDEKKGIIQIRPTNIDEDGLLKFDKNIFIRQEYLIKKRDELIKKGEILFNNTNSQELVGKTALFNIDGNYFCSNHITRIKANEKHMMPKYLWILLNIYQRKKVFFSICTNWNNQSGVNIELLKTVKIPIPLLDIQKQIIGTIEEALSQKKQKEQEAQQLLDSIDSYILEELGIELPESRSEMFYIVDSEEIEGRLDPSSYNPIRINTIKKLKSFEYQLLLLKDVVEFKRIIITSNLKNLPYVGLENIESDTGILIESEVEKESFGTAFEFQKGDILFPKLRPYLNKVHFAEFDGICSTEFHVLVPRECDNFYFFTFLRSRLVLNQTTFLMTGNTLPRLQTNDIESLLVPIPPLETQTKIANEVKSRIEKAKRLREEARTILEEAKARVEKIILGEEEIES